MFISQTNIFFALTYNYCFSTFWLGKALVMMMRLKDAFWQGYVTSASLFSKGRFICFFFLNSHYEKNREEKIMYAKNKKPLL